MNQSPDNKPSDDFSLVLGGPLYQLFIRAQLGTDTLGLVKRRIMVFSSFTWLQLLLVAELVVHQRLKPMRLRPQMASRPATAG